MPRLQLYVVRCRVLINYKAVRFAICDLEGKGALADKTLDDRQDKRELPSVYEGCDDVLVPKKLGNVSPDLFSALYRE